MSQISLHVHVVLVEIIVEKLRHIYSAGTPFEVAAIEDIDLVINIPKNYSTLEMDNGYKIRRAAIDFNIPLITNARLATAFIRAFCAMSADDIQIKSWDQY